MRLRKWYLDLVTGEGDAIILYWARLDGFGLAIHYSALLVARRGFSAVTTSSLARVEPPRVVGRAIAWSHEPLGVSGQWPVGGPPLERTLLESDHGTIAWSLYAAGPSARVSIGDESLAGTGYAECLETTVLPWKMPIRELRWGRFLTAAGDAIVWIEWIGPAPRLLVLSNRSEPAPGTISIDDRRVSWTDDRCRSELWLEKESTLRDGALGPQVLSRIPGVDRLSPAAFLKSRETKWLSRGTLNCGAKTVEGWAIHERVLFEGMDGT
jgi:hypothetical protein